MVRGDELGPGPGHVVAGHDEDDLPVAPPQQLHAVPEVAALVAAQDVPDVALLPPHPQLVPPPGVDQSEDSIATL